MRVVTSDGETLELTDPRVHNDTLIGGAVPDTGWVFVALADITKVQVRKKDAFKTGLAVVLMAGVVLAVAALCKNPTTAPPRRGSSRLSACLHSRPSCSISTGP